MQKSFFRSFSKFLWILAAKISAVEDLAIVYGYVPATTFDWLIRKPPFCTDGYDSLSKHITFSSESL